MLTIQEHKSSSYAPRTYYNASQGVTLAIAVDFKTAGEKLTKKAAGEKFVSVEYGTNHVEAARELYKALRKYKCNVVNVAGNGIYTYSKYRITQEQVNRYVYSIIELVNRHWKIERIVSGGQTGVDLAGLVAGVKLEIDSVGTLPNGYKMRFEDGVDVNMNKETVEELVYGYAK